MRGAGAGGAGSNVLGGVAQGIGLVDAGSQGLNGRVHVVVGLAGAEFVVPAASAEGLDRSGCIFNMRLGANAKRAKLSAAG